MFIPEERLPPGFMDTIGRGGAAAVPRPASTVALMRDATPGPEVLLLRRNRSSGFVPGAYVFAGGRVDAADADPLPWSGPAMPGIPPAEYWAAALRELFEETGVLLARDAGGAYAADASDPALSVWRDTLLEDEATLAGMLDRLGLMLAGDRIVHFAHWITPVAEPRRYDTHFFLAGMPESRTASADAREMSDAVWLTPAAALDRFADGTLPMVFPTVRSLESLAAFDSVQSALDYWRDRQVAPVLPRLVRTGRGVSLVVDEGAQAE